MARNVKQLHPWLQHKLDKLVKECEKQGLKVGIGECFRTVAEQNVLYAQGRSKPGKVVTNAKGDSFSSQHQWGVAVDLFQNIKGKEWEEAFFKKVAKIAKSNKIGLGWGGDWTSFKDTPHFYLKKWGSTTAKLKSKYKNVNTFKKYWNRTTKKKCRLWSKNSLRKSTSLKKIPAGSEVVVLYYSKLGYAKVKYKGKVGYIFRSVLKGVK